MLAGGRGKKQAVFQQMYLLVSGASNYVAFQHIRKLVVVAQTIRCVTQHAVRNQKDVIPMQWYGMVRGDLVMQMALDMIAEAKGE